MNRFNYLAVGGLVVLLGIGAKSFLRDDPTHEEVNGLKSAMPALVKEDFLRLVQSASHPDSVPWRQAYILKIGPPFEDWYGVTGKHSLKINVVARRQDGALFSATYRVALDDRACTKQPNKCASLDGVSAFTGEITDERQVAATIEPVRAYARSAGRLEGGAYRVMTVPEGSVSYNQGMRFVAVPEKNVADFSNAGSRLAD